MAVDLITSILLDDSATLRLFLKVNQAANTCLVNCHLCRNPSIFCIFSDIQTDT